MPINAQPCMSIVQIWKKRPLFSSLLFKAVCTYSPLDHTPFTSKRFEVTFNLYDTKPCCNNHNNGVKINNTILDTRG